MFDSKSLSDEQISTIKGWVEEGAQLSDIQKKMEDDFDVKLTYMDTRFLVLDLGLELKSNEPEVADDEEEVAEESEGDEKSPEELTEDDIEVLPHDAGGENVTVTVDEIARPGVMVSGRVNFSDGESGMWYVDEMGRLGIDPDTAGYRPSEANIMAFQKELQRVMDKH